MIIFRAIKESLVICGIRSPQSFEQFHRFNLRNSMILIQFVASTALMVLFLTCENGTMSEYASAIFGILSSTITGCLILLFIWKTEQLYKLIDKFEDIVRNRSEYPKSKLIYEEANKMIEKWTERIQFWFTTLTMWVLTAIFIATLVILSIIKYTKGLDNYKYSAMFPAWFPFDRDTFPMEYTLAYSFELSFTYILIFCAGISIKFLNGSRIILTAYIEDIKQELRSLNDRQKSEHQNQTEIQLKTAEIIKFHSDVKQLVNDLLSIYKFILTAYFGWCLLTTCVTLLVFQSEISKGAMNAIDMINACYRLCYAFGILFIYCEMGEQISGAFGDIEDVMYQMDWDSFPIQTQKMMLIILTNAQQPLEFMGFGNFPANRGTMKRIGNGGFSYSLIFRGFI